MKYMKYVEAFILWFFSMILLATCISTDAGREPILLSALLVFVSSLWFGSVIFKK